jgi:hypothetical protein
MNPVMHRRIRQALDDRSYQRSARTERRESCAIDHPGVQGPLEYRQSGVIAFMLNDDNFQAGY